MEKRENEENGLMQSQQSLFTKLIKINRLFNVQFYALLLSILFSLAFLILWVSLLFIMSPQYGFIGTSVIIIQILVLSGLIIQTGVQVLFYGKLMLSGNRSLKQIKNNEHEKLVLVPYITNFHAFFNRYSKENTTLVKLVRKFLFINIVSGLVVIFLGIVCYLLFILFTWLLGDVASHLIYLILVLFIPMLVFWLINLGTSFNIKNKLVKWESMFTKLEEWGKELELNSSNDSKYLNNDEFPN